MRPNFGKQRISNGIQMVIIQVMFDFENRLSTYSSHWKFNKKVICEIIFVAKIYNWMAVQHFFFKSEVTLTRVVQNSGF